MKKQYKVTVTVNDKDRLTTTVEANGFKYVPTEGMLYLFNEESIAIAMYPAVRVCECVQVDKIK
jgi:hypothetical protein